MPIYGFQPVRAEFNLGDASPFKRRLTWINSDGHSRLLVAYEKFNPATGEKIGDFFKLSSDSGASFGPERTLPHSLLQSGAVRFAFFKGGLAAVYTLARQSDLFYTRSATDGATWSEPVQINDELDSVLIGGGGDFSFVQPSENEIYCLWTDTRRGFWLTFFSASHDGGRTWTPNQPVDYDFREGAQQLPHIVRGAGGRLLAFWTDGRDRQTLFDIRCSYSDDGGRHWSASQQLNDDREHVWQTFPGAVAKDNHIYVVFGDYREVGAEGDIDANIYFTRSDDNGEMWSKNVRLNDVQEGVDDYPLLTIDEQDTLYCLWRSCRESIFGDVYLAVSTDGGQSWSRSIKVNEDGELAFRSGRLVSRSHGKLLCGWWEIRPGSNELHVAWLEPLSAPLPAEAPAPVVERKAPPAFNQGRRLFADDFSSGSLSGWRKASGVWTLVDGALMGVEPGALDVFSIFARFNEPESYILQGRFKLDPVHHQMAYLYFRAGPAHRQSYIIGNGFRTGVCLSLKEDRAPAVGAGGAFRLDGQPLVQRRFPFQNNRWYEFTLVVTPERVDYYVEGRWLLSFEERLRLPPGSFGVGGFDAAPTYFDDLAVYEKR